jgi:hypothetical protein
MVTIKIDRRAFYVVVGLLVLLVPLGLGVHLGRSRPQAGTTQSQNPTAPAAGAPTVPVAAIGQNPSAAQNQAQAPIELPTADPTLAAVPRITIDEAIKRYGQPDAVFVDARTSDQYQQGHIKDAISVPELEVQSKMAELPRDKELIIYCA